MKKKRMYVRYNEQEKNKNRKKTYKWFFFLFNSCYIFDIKIKKKKRKGRYTRKNGASMTTMSTHGHRKKCFTIVSAIKQQKKKTYRILHQSQFTTPRPA